MSINSTMKKVLVIDDERDILDALRLLLEAEGYSVETSMDGGDIAMRLDNFPDIILLDVLLSGKDGRVIAKKLKSQERTKHIPIIMMSAHPTAKDTIDEYQADYFLPKPFEADHLLRKIKDFV